jgi:hypothetical protein
LKEKTEAHISSTEGQGHARAIEKISFHFDFLQLAHTLDTQAALLGTIYRILAGASGANSAGLPGSAESYFLKIEQLRKDRASPVKQR